MHGDAATKGDDHRFRQQRRQRIRELLAQGATRKQIALKFAEDYGVSRLLAYRWAYDLTLKEAAAGYNDATGDADARMDAPRLSRYENWLHGTNGIQPRVGVLQALAQVYHCAPGDLLDGTDYTDQPGATAELRMGDELSISAGEDDPLDASPDQARSIRQHGAPTSLIVAGDLTVGSIAVQGGAALEAKSAVHASEASIPVHVQRIRDRLMRYDSINGTPAGEPVDVQTLRRSVTKAWEVFQRSDYSALAARLPGLVDDAAVVVGAFDGADRFRANELLSESLQLVAILLLKHGDSNLAWVAADRAILAAERAQAPLTIAGAARILAYALLGAGHYDNAKQLSLAAAGRLEDDLGSNSPQVLSAYGALLLKAGIAAAMQDDRATTSEVLTLAGNLADRLGHDGNHLWTAFGPTNVLVHHVSAAVELGDAGVAIEHAKQVHPDRLPVLERRAHHLIDVSRAYGQRSKTDAALAALLEAEQVAPEEVQVSPQVRTLVVELLHQTPRSIPELRAFAQRVRVA